MILRALGVLTAERLVQANRAGNPPNAGSKTYSYSAEGLLEATSTTRGTNTKTNEYLWDTSSAIPSLLEATQGSTKTEYIYGNGSSPTASVSGDDITYLHTDRQGSIIGASDDEGDLKFARTYTEYGQDEAVFGSSADIPKLGYTGALKDSFTGNYYLTNRFYDPETTRFLNVDPLLRATHSAYSYVSGNPLNSSDPLGLSTVGDALVGAVDGLIWDGVGSWLADNLFNYTPDLCSTAYVVAGGIALVASAVLPPGPGTAKAGAKVALKTTTKAIGSAEKVVSKEAVKATDSVDKSVDLYRAVGVREYNDIMASNRFDPKANSLEGRQFALTLDEAVAYADRDPSKVAVIKANVTDDSLKGADFSKSIDPFIFKNGVYTIQPGAQSDRFHKGLLGVSHVF